MFSVRLRSCAFKMYVCHDLHDHVSASFTRLSILHVVTLTSVFADSTNQHEYGVVQSVDHAGRTCVLKWIKPNVDGSTVTMYKNTSKLQLHPVARRCISHITKVVSRKYRSVRVCVLDHPTNRVTR